MEHSALYKAVKRGDAIEVRRLLSEGYDPNETSGGFDTPLFVAAARGNTPILRLLLDAGAKPDHYTLRAAAFGGYGRAVRLLLAAGAPVDPDRRETRLLNSLTGSRKELDHVRTLLRDAGGRELPDWYLRWRWSLRYGWRWRLRRWLYAVRARRKSC